MQFAHCSKILLSMAILALTACGKAPVESVSNQADSASQGGAVNPTDPNQSDGSNATPGSGSGTGDGTSTGTGTSPGTGSGSNTGTGAITQPVNPTPPPSNVTPSPGSVAGTCYIQLGSGSIKSLIDRDYCERHCVEHIALNPRSSVTCSFNQSNFYQQTGGYKTRISRQFAEDYAVKFNEADYLLMYPDIAEAIKSGNLESGYQHYTNWGAKEMRDPNLAFSTIAYVSNNTDVLYSRQFSNGWDHFVRYGVNEDRTFCLVFDELGYMREHKDVGVAVLIKKTVGSALEHYVNYGRAEGRKVPLKSASSRDKICIQ